MWYPFALCFEKKNFNIIKGKICLTRYLFDLLHSQSAYGKKSISSFEGAIGLGLNNSNVMCQSRQTVFGVQHIEVIEHI